MKLRGRFAAASIILACMLAPSTMGCQKSDAHVELPEGIASIREVAEGEWEWSSDAECSLCHETQVETVAARECEISGGARGSCLPCHSNVSALRDAHELPFDRTNIDGLRKTEANADICEDCHSSNELASATTESSVLSDNECTIVNPHALPEAGSHDTIACLDCHLVHKGNLAEASAMLCTNCHHQNVFECGTCHE